MRIFESVKDGVDLRRAAERMGLDVTRSGMACCPFHRERTPSMKLYDDHFYCFGCHAHGDVIDLAARLSGLGKYDAAKALAREYGIVYDNSPITERDRQMLKKKRETAETLRETESRLFRALAEYRNLLRERSEALVPVGDEPPCRDFMEAVQMLDPVEYLCGVLATGEPQLRRELTLSLSPRLCELEEYVRSLR